MRLMTATALALSMMSFAAHADDAQLKDVLAKETPAFMSHMPIQGTLSGASVADMGGPYANRTERFDQKSVDAARAQAAKFRQMIEAVDPATLSQTSKEWREAAAMVVKGVEGVPGIQWGVPDLWFGHLPYVLNQAGGPAKDLTEAMATQQKVTTVAEAKVYVEKLTDLAKAINTVEEKMKADAKLGVVPPAAILEGSITFLDAFTKPSPGGNRLLSSLMAKVDAIPGIDYRARSDIMAAATVVIKSKVYPAFQSLRAAAAELARNPAKGDGIWAQPDGDKFYDFIAAYHGDTTLTPDEIHEVGLKEVARIAGEMDQILQEIDLVEGTVAERMVQLSSRPDFIFPDTNEGRNNLITYLNDQTAKILAKVPDWFGKIPPQKLEIRRVPISSQDGSAGGYYTAPSLDGSMPGIYWINLKDMSANPIIGLKTLTYHEGVPGHHFQNALNMDNKDLPFLLRLGTGFNAYGEGWALYTENLAVDMGMYEGDPWSDLGRLQDEMFRAVRLVVDTGLHRKKWTREQAIAYMKANVGSADSEVKREIERYMAWPGQALGYKLGMIRILEMREKAKAELGDKFDIKGFHDTILLGGAVPLKTLEGRINAWVASKK